MIERLYEARYLFLSAILAGVSLYWSIQAARARWWDYKIERNLPKCLLCERPAETDDTLCWLHAWKS